MVSHPSAQGDCQAWPDEFPPDQTLEALPQGSYRHGGPELLPSPAGIPVLCCLMSSVEKPLFHTSCPFSYLFPVALSFHLGPKVKSFPQF